MFGRAVQASGRMPHRPSDPELQVDRDLRRHNGQSARFFLSRERKLESHTPWGVHFFKENWKWAQGGWDAGLCAGWRMRDCRKLARTTSAGLC